MSGKRVSERAKSTVPAFTASPKRASDKALALIRWDEKAGLQRDAIRSQCLTCSKHKKGDRL
jgi:hypothetical protein